MFFVVLLSQSNRGPFHSVSGSSYLEELCTAEYILIVSESILFDLFYFGVILFVIICITCSSLQPFCGCIYFHIYSWTFERMMFKYDLLESPQFNIYILLSNSFYTVNLLTIVA